MHIIYIYHVANILRQKVPFMLCNTHGVAPCLILKFKRRATPCLILKFKRVGPTPIHAQNNMKECDVPARTFFPIYIFTHTYPIETRTL